MTTVADDLIGLAHDADILIHEVADLGYLERHGMAGEALQRMAALHTGVAEVGPSPNSQKSANRSSITTCSPGRTRVGAACQTQLQRENHRGPRRPAADARRLRA